MSATDLIVIGVFAWLALIIVIIWLYDKLRQKSRRPEPVIMPHCAQLEKEQKSTIQETTPQKKAVPKPKPPLPTPPPEIKPAPKPDPLPAPKPIWLGVRNDVRSMKHKVYAAERIFSFDKKYLQENGYSRYWFVPLGKVRQREFYIASSKNESPLHTFLVWSACRLLRKACVTKIEPPEPEKPDIVFTKFKRTYAIEVETNRSIKRDKVLEKVQANNKDYGKRSWFFLVAVSKQAKLYQRYARTMSRNQFAQWVKTLK